MDDGWDDEDDVNVDDLLDDWGGEPDGGEDNGGIGLHPPAPPAASAFPTASTTAATTTAAPTEGWEDDSDNLDLSDDDDSGRKINIPPPTAVPPVQEEGWEEDFDMDLTESSHQPAGGAAAPTRQTPPQQVAEPAAVTEGWGDEVDDLDFSENNSNHQKKEEALAEVAAPEAAEGLDDDFDFSETTSNDPLKNNEPQPIQQQPQQKQPMSAAQQKLHQELEHYIATLPSHAVSITAVLQAEYNTPQKALELQHYYAERPQLQDYTITKELARMDYTLTSSSSEAANDGGDVITDKNEIAQHLLNSSSTRPSLCARCANQSLLADVLQVLTGPDRVVRPQYLAAAVASQCKLRIDLSHSLTEVVAVLDLSLPTAATGTADRWTIAQLCVVIVFVAPWPGDPHQPYVEYRLAELRPTAAPTDPDWSERLESCSAFLARLAQDQVHLELQQQQQQQQEENATLNFRDAFLQQSRLASTDAVDGLKSAWQDLNAATGLGDKFARLPSFLPEAEVLEAAAAQEQEQLALLQQQQQQQQAAAASHQQRSQSHQQRRPTSILGGFVRNLAKSVALPDEDPDLYQEWSAKNKNAPPPASISAHRPPPGTHPGAAVAPPKLYNAETPAAKPTKPTDIPKLYHRGDASSEAPSAIPKLYNRDPTPQQKSSTEEIPPRLYNLETPQSPPKAKVDSAPQLYVREDKQEDAAAAAKNPDADMEVDDGWGDDFDFDVVDDAVDGDNNTKDAAAPVSASTTPAAPSRNPPQASAATKKKKDHDNVEPIVDWQNWKYDPATDVIPTRKRWVNPLPGRRVLGEFGGV